MDSTPQLETEETKNCEFESNSNNYLPEETKNIKENQPADSLMELEQGTQITCDTNSTSISHSKDPIQQIRNKSILKIKKNVSFNLQRNCVKLF